MPLGVALRLNNVNTVSRVSLSIDDDYDDVGGDILMLNKFKITFLFCTNRVVESFTYAIDVLCPFLFPSSTLK